MSPSLETSVAGSAVVAAAPNLASHCRRILVVDDDAIVRRRCSEALSHRGYQVDAAEDGAAAWDALQLGHYDLVVTDNSMPKVSGVELVLMLRAAHMELPVILMSAAMPVRELNQHPELHLAAALLKPFTGPELLGTVNDVLEPAKDTVKPRVRVCR
jgi:CheY-like chemotaxis protein